MDFDALDHLAPLHEHIRQKPRVQQDATHSTQHSVLGRLISIIGGREE